MSVVFEDFRRGWARGRAMQPGADELPQSSVGNSNKEIKSLAEVTALADQLEARNRELEAELAASPAALFAEVLRLSGVRQWLASRFHPDKHRDANETEREWLTAATQKVNAAYAALEKKDGP
jgi:hypothetical protein